MAILALVVVLGVLLLHPLAVWAMAKAGGRRTVSFGYAVVTSIGSSMLGMGAGVVTGAVTPGIAAITVQVLVAVAAFCWLLSRGERMSPLRAAWILFGSTLAVAALVVVVRLLLVSPFEVKGQSMEPAFHADDLLIVEKLSYRFRNPRRGDVVVLIPPSDRTQYYVERIVGLPGESIQFLDGEVVLFNEEYREGKALEEPYLPDSSTTYGVSTKPVEIPDGSFFTLGDNREHSNDSRIWGLLPKANIVGRVWFRLWPE